MNLPAFVRHISGRGIQLGLDRMEHAWERLQGVVSPGNLERRVVLVAGTNGKGSTAKRVESACRRLGKRTFLYTSPHLTCVEERYRFDGRRVNAGVLERAHQRCVDLFPDGQTEVGALTPFEWMTLVGLELALSCDADVWILEVGLGGRFDATNVVTPDLSIITTIGRDHMDRLGGTLEEVAFEKAGILRRGTSAILGETAAPFIEHSPGWTVGKEICWARVDSSFELQGPGGSIKIDVPIDFPAGAEESLAMAITAAHYLTDATPSESVDSAIAAARARWPARFQILREAPLLVVDGAHNEPAMTWLLAALNARFPGQKFHIVAGFRPDKAVLDMLKILAPLGSSWTFVRDQARMLQAPSSYVNTLLPHLTGQVTSTEDSVVDVVSRLTEPVLVCGSLYLCGELLAQMGLQQSLETLG